MFYHIYEHINMYAKRLHALQTQTLLHIYLLLDMLAEGIIQKSRQ